MENINRYIISQLKRPVDRLKLMATGNIINILSAKELCSLYDEIAEITDDSNTYDWDAIHKVLRLVRRATWNKDGGNKSISELIQLYKDTGSKMAGDELCERFEYQSFEVQKCIFKTLIHTDYFLELYPYLNDTWCKILVDDPRFVVARTKCGYKWEYYRVMQHLGEDVDREQLLMELFEVIASYIKNASRYTSIIEQHLDMLGGGCIISAQLILDVAIAIREFCNMGLHDEVFLFHEWDTSIRQKVDKEFATRYVDPQNEFSFREMWLMYCRIARCNFPEKYAYMVAEDPRRIERRNEMIAELAPLIEKYGFEVEADMDESFSLWNDDAESSNEYKAIRISEEVPF